MKPNAALVGSNGHAVLNAVAAVDLNAALVVHPRHAKHDHPLGLDQALEQAVLGIARVLLNKRPQAFHDLGHGLHEFGLVRVALANVVDKLVGGGVSHDIGNYFGAKNDDFAPMACVFETRGQKFFCKGSVHPS